MKAKVKNTGEIVEVSMIREYKFRGKRVDNGAWVHNERRFYIMIIQTLINL